MARMCLSSGPVLSCDCASNGEDRPPQRFAQFRPNLDDFPQIRAGRGNWCAYRCVRKCLPQANCRFSQVQALYRAPSSRVSGWHGRLARSAGPLARRQLRSSGSARVSLCWDARGRAGTALPAFGHWQRRQRSTTVVRRAVDCPPYRPRLTYYKMKNFSFAYLRETASICGQFRIRLRLVAPEYAL